MGNDAGSSVSDASLRCGRPEAALDWCSLQSVVYRAIDECRKRLQGCVDENRSHFEHLL